MFVTQGDATPEGFKENMRTALTSLKSSLPKTLVVLISPYDPTKISLIPNMPFQCQLAYGAMCPCLTENSRPGLVALRDQYEQKLVELAEEMR